MMIMQLKVQNAYGAHQGGCDINQGINWKI